MTGVAATLLLVNQLAGPPESRTAWSEYESKVQRAESPDSPPEAALAARRLEFEKRFQAVVAAMNRFSEKYNQFRGHVWPVKEAADVARAYRELERLERSFDENKNTR